MNTTPASTSTDIQTAIRQVQKLLKLANHANTSVEESTVAAARAQDLMMRYKIAHLAASEITGDSEAPCEEIINFATKGAPLYDENEGKIARWRSVLACVIARTNGCRVFQSRRINIIGSAYKSSTTLEIIGRASDVDGVRYLFSYLQNEVDRLTRSHGKGCGRVWCNNFRLGIVEAISTKLKEQEQKTRESLRQEAQANSSMALVRIDNALTRMDKERNELNQFVNSNLRLRTTQATTIRSDPSAREAGRQAGSKIVISGAKAGLGAGRRGIKG